MMKFAKLFVVTVLIHSTLAFAGGISKGIYVCRNNSKLIVQQSCEQGCSIRYFANANDSSSYSSGQVSFISNNPVGTVSDEDGHHVGSLRMIGSSLILAIEKTQTVCHLSGSLFQ
jgi:hypothetical protein